MDYDIRYYFDNCKLSIYFTDTSYWLLSMKYFRNLTNLRYAPGEKKKFKKMYTINLYSIM